MNTPAEEDRGLNTSGSGYFFILKKIIIMIPRSSFFQDGIEESSDEDVNLFHISDSFNTTFQGD